MHATSPDDAEERISDELDNDVAMPGMSGYEVAERLRATPHGRRMLLIAATGWGSEADRQASALAGFDAHLIKPVVVDELRSMIANWSAPER